MHEKEFILKNREGKRILATLRTAYLNKKEAVKGTMVLLHGLGGWREQYLLVTVAEAVRAQGYNVVTFDAADGAKGPDGDFSRGTTTGYVEDLEDVISSIKKEDWYIGPVVLAAHSQGGLVALRYARKHAKELQTTNSVDDTHISKVLLLAPAVSWKIGLPWTLPFGAWWLISNKYKTPGPGPARTMLPLRRSWLLDFMKYDACKDAKYVHVPTLIISAGKDNTVGHPKTHGKVNGCLKDSKQVVIEGANHIFYKHEFQVAGTITKWLENSHS
jgi:pimeloyl-ACP methyl ester carboxylesterase